MLVEKPFSQPCSRPALFVAIINNDEQRRIAKDTPVVKLDDFRRLNNEHRDFMRAAEKATAGTKNKGTRI